MFFLNYSNICNKNYASIFFEINLTLKIKSNLNAAATTSF